VVILQDCPDQFQFVKNLVGRLDHEVWSWAFPTLHWRLWICYQLLLFFFSFNFFGPDACIIGLLKLQQRVVFLIILLASCFYLAFIRFRLYVGDLPWTFPFLCILLANYMYLYVPKNGLDLELILQIKHPFQFNSIFNYTFGIKWIIQFNLHFQVIMVRITERVVSTYFARLYLSQVLKTFQFINDKKTPLSSLSL